MSSSKDDVLLEERIEKIRRKNEEIKRRHKEVEADKQHAAKLNALVQPRAHTEDWTSSWSAPVVDKHQQYERDRNESHQSTPHTQQTPPKAGRRRDHNTGENHRPSKQNGKSYSFTEGNGPPADPVYRFLADSERDLGEERPGRRGSRSAGGRSTTSRQRDRARPQPHKDMRQSRHHAEYEAWRAERNQIDQDRINRQKTADGMWRREWDNEKVTQNFEDDVEFPRSRPSQGRIGSSRLGSVSVEYDTESSKVPTGSPPPGKRNIRTVDGTLTVSITNTTHPDTTAPLQRVRVKPPTVVGSGRVGPRQKARMSYSSQSEDEHHSPQRLTRTIDNTPAPMEKNTQVVKCNPASLRPPLPPAAPQDGCGSRKQRDGPSGSRQSRKRALRGEYCKRDGQRTESTSSSQGNMSEGAGDGSWEDVTTSGAESACETSEDKTKNADRSDKSRPSGRSGPVNGESRKTISNKQAQNVTPHENTKRS